MKECCLCNKEIDNEDYETVINFTFGEVVFCASCWSGIFDAVTNTENKKDE